MFNKQKKQQQKDDDAVDEISKYVKMHTMQNDIDGNRPTVGEQSASPADQNSPFLGGGKNNNSGQMPIKNTATKKSSFITTKGITKKNKESAEINNQDALAGELVSQNKATGLNLAKKNYSATTASSVSEVVSSIATPQIRTVSKPKVTMSQSPSTQDQKKVTEPILKRAPINRVNSAAPVVSRADELLTHSAIPKNRDLKESLEKAASMRQPIKTLADNEKKKEVKIVKKRKPKKMGLYMVFAGTIILMLSLAGAYVFWQAEVNSMLASLGVGSSKKVEEIILPAEPVAPVEIEEAVSIFSDKVNFLTIESEKDEIDNSAVMVAINQTLFEMNNEEVDSLEFLVVDKNNQEIGLSSFAAAMSITIDENMAKLMTNKFSLFLSTINGVDRVGISIEITEEGNFKELVLRNENSLVKNFTPLFLGNLVLAEMATQPFQSSEYGEVLIKYNNINEEKNLSIDYFFMENNWIIATSMDSGRKIIDKNIENLNTNIENSENLNTNIESIGE